MTSKAWTTLALLSLTKESPIGQSTLLAPILEERLERFATIPSLEALKMQAQWVGKNVDLTLLSQCVEDFFKGRGFKTAKDRSKEGYTVSGKPQRGGDILGRVIVRILGGSHDFSVEFLASKDTRSAIRSGFITTMFGGGILLLRALKSQEALEKLENDFWIYIEEEMTRLIDSTS